MLCMAAKLELKHLATLDALAQTGGPTAAAARLGVTQSAVTHRLREAERRLGAPLALRTEGRMALTAEGERLRALGVRFLAELERLEREIDANGRSGGALVRLGQSTYNRYHWLPAFLEVLAEVDPALTVDISGRAATRPFAALLEGSVDVSMVYGRPTASDRFRWLRLGPDPLLALVAPSHPLAAHPVIDSSVIGDTRVYLYPLSGEPGHEWETMIGAPQSPFRTVARMPTPEAVVDLLRAGFGVGFFSRWAAAPEIADGSLVARPIGDPGVTLDWYAVTRAGDPEDSPAARLARALVGWAERTKRPLSTLAFDAAPR